MGISLAELQSKTDEIKQKKKYDFSLYSWKDKRIPVPHSMNIKRLADNILAMNERVSYVSVLLSGKSGSGKSSTITTLLHRISCCNEEPYIIKWFSGKDLHDLDKITDNLKKGLKYCLVFDDISFVMDMTGSAQRKKELANALTTIRHRVQGKVICFFSIHYMTALIPMMRDSDFRILTSMSDQDKKNWIQTLGWHNQYKINKFQVQYASQMQRGIFYINHAEQDKQNNMYYTDNPFRLALCSEINGVHNVLVPSEGCKLCSEQKQNPKERINAEEFFNDISKAYSIRGKTALGYWMYFMKGRSDCMPAQSARAIKYVTKMLANYDIDFEELSKVISKSSPSAKKKILPLSKKGVTPIHTRERNLLEKSGILPDFSGKMGIFEPESGQNSEK
ncbi:hypothetical protein AAA799E16_01407 [Marine Group I thaumarchaeote SCGC AAA799-E16]|uniref:Uncharacterized protein n=2 Tax=Marine Group I TaxID=905826 RepID=A0A087RXU4_9ARCH|nr:hypothetical protein AAA799E16_01407 [Marine Group I thaumarchaeote SCGC AAA799-E16]KFM18298.1 hypothetical protein SCCGRSA3_01217 [Marine Group I thaumarchaeote SCGC RSA3]